MCHLSMACCQSQHQCHFLRMNLMFKAYCTGNKSLAAANQCHSRGCERLQKSKVSLKACFENVNIEEGLVENIQKKTKSFSKYFYFCHEHCTSFNNLCGIPMHILSQEINTICVHESQEFV